MLNFPPAIYAPRDEFSLADLKICLSALAACINVDASCLLGNLKGRSPSPREDAIGNFR